MKKFKELINIIVENTGVYVSYGGVEAVAVVVPELTGKVSNAFSPGERKRKEQRVAQELEGR